MVFRSLTYGVAAILLLNACAIQPNFLGKNPKPVIRSDFKTLSNNDPAYDSAPVPVASDFPLAEPEDEIEVLSAGADLPVSLTLDRSAPKNLSTDIEGMSMLPLKLEYETLPEDSLKVSREKYTATIQEIRAFRQYLREHKNFLQAELRRLQKEDIAKAEHNLRLTLGNAPDNTAKKAAREAHKLTVQEIREKYKRARNQINQVHQEDQTQLKEKITEYKIARANLKKPSGDFQTQLEPITVVAIGFGIIAFGGLVGGLLYLGHQQNQELEKANRRRLAANPLPPTESHSIIQGPITLPVIDSEQLSQPAQTIRETDIAPRVLAQQLSQSFEQDLQNIQQSFDSIANAKSSFAPIFLAIRAMDLYDKLNTLASSKGLTLNLDDSDIREYQHCGDLVRKVFSREVPASSLAECDIANQAVAVPMGAEALSIFRESDQTQTPFLSFIQQNSYLLDAEYNDDGTQSLVFSLTYGSQDQSKNLQTWLLQIFNKYFPNSFPKEDTGVSPNAQVIRELVPETAQLKVKLKGPPSCHQNPDLELSVGKVADVTGVINTSGLLMDGDYTYAVGFFDPATQHTETLLNYTLPHLTHTLKLSARQKAQNILDPYPLQILPTHPHIRALTGASDPSSAYNERRILSFLVKNNTGNLFNTRILRVGENDQAAMCYDFYRGDCISSSSAAFNFDYRRIETGLYDVVSEYSNARNEEPTGQFQIQQEGPPAGRLIPAVVDGFNDVTTGHVMFNQPAFMDPFRAKPARLRVLSANGFYHSFSRYLPYPEDVSSFAKVDTHLGAASPKQLELSSYASNSYLHSYDNQEFEVSEDPAITLPGYPEGSFEAEIKAVFDKLRQSSYFATNGQLSEQGKPFANLLQDILGRIDTKSRSIDPAQEAQAKHLHVGAVVSLRNGSPAFNNMFLNPGATDENFFAEGMTVPLRLQVIQNSEKVAEWKFQAPLGTVSYVERYWDGRHLGADTSAQEPEAPRYIQGDYEIRVVPDSEALGSYLGAAAVRNDVRKAYALAPYIFQPEDGQGLQVPDGNGRYKNNYFGASRVGTIRIQSNSNNAGAAAGSREPDDILWEYVQKADDLFPGFDSEFSQLRTAFNQPNYQIASSAFGGGFGLAQSSETDYESGQIPTLGANPQFISKPFKVDEAKEALMREKLKAIFEIEHRIDNIAAQINVKRLNNQLASAETEVLMGNIGVDISTLNILLRGAMSQGWLNSDMIRLLGKIQIKNTYRAIGLTSFLLPITMSTPNYEYVIQRLWDTLASFSGVGDEIDKASDALHFCESLNSNSIGDDLKEKTRDYLTNRSLYLYWEYGQLMNDLNLFIQKKAYGAEADFVPFEKRLKTLFLEAYRTKNYMTFLCSSCTAEDRRQEILKDDLTETSISQYDVLFKNNVSVRDYLMKPVKQQLAPRTVTEENLKCRVCKMSNNREREDFGVALRLRQGFVRERNQKRDFGIPGRQFQKASVGFSLLTNPIPEAVYKSPIFMVSFSSEDSSLILEDLENKDQKLSQEELKTEFLQRLIQMSMPMKS